MIIHPTKLRPGENGKDPVPSLYDLAGSAHWRNKADAGIVVYRDYGKSLTFLIAKKIRRQPMCGSPGSVKLQFIGADRRFSPIAEYPADGLVLHPTRWAKIELTKDGEQRYIFANVIQMAGPQLWGRPVIATQAMDEDEFLAGAFKMAAKIWDRMDVEVLISSEDRDNFVKNMLTVRAEERLALAVKRPAALVAGSFTD